MSALVVNANTSAVTILLPSISEDVGAPVAQLQWAVTGYSLVGAAVIVTSGALGDVLGRRKIFIAGLALFVASCALIALSTGAAGVVGGRMIQGASGATILACGMSLLSVASSGSGQIKAITLWGAASAAGAALGPLIGGLLVDTTGWQGLFWIDAAIAAACVPLTLATVQESSDPDRPRSIDLAGTVLVALILAPADPRAEQGQRLGLGLGRDARLPRDHDRGDLLFVRVERRVAAPLVDLQLLRNRVLVGATLAILIVGGTINGLMYVISLYFQNPDALGMSAFEAGLATLPAAAGMIVITPFITPLAVRIGPGRAVGIGFALATWASSRWRSSSPPGRTPRSSCPWSRSPSAWASPTARRRRARRHPCRPTRSARRPGSPTWRATSAPPWRSPPSRWSTTRSRTTTARPGVRRRRARRGVAAASVLMAVWSALGVALIVLLRRAKQSRPRDRSRRCGSGEHAHHPDAARPEARPHPPAATAASVT